jgi:hypothetical protein
MGRGWGGGGLWGMLNDQTSKGCGINSLGQGGYNKLSARPMDSIGTM